MSQAAPTSTPPVLVVNLDRSADRWESCQEVFREQQLSVERFSATDGRALSSEELQDVATFPARHFCTPGMIGCFLSHQRIWSRVVEEDLPAVIVFEDDVRLYPDFQKRVKEVLDELPKDWDVCLLGAVACINPVREPIFMKYYSFLTGGGRASPGKTRTISPHVFVPHRPAGTHAYIVSRKGAAKLLERLPKARYHVDLSAWALKDLNLYAAKDFLATQAFEEASTVSRRGSRTKAFLRWLWSVSGFAYMGKMGGVEHLGWAWKAAIFALPVPFTRRKLAVAMGPSSSLFVAMMCTAMIFRSAKVLGIAIAYEGIICCMIRFLCGTWSTRFALGHAILAMALLTFPWA